ncbi:hypothetical protein [Streptomyces sp. NPDC002559]
MSSVFREELAAANARIEYGNSERTAGADDKARAIAAEVARLGGGKAAAEELAAELGVTPKTVFQAITRAKRAPAPGRVLPGDTLERLLAAELKAVAPLAPLQWEFLAWLVRGTVIDPVWIEQPGQLLAHEVEDADPVEGIDPEALAAVCRGWSRAQALAVIDTCQRDDIASLPMQA